MNINKNKYTMKKLKIVLIAIGIVFAALIIWFLTWAIPTTGNALKPFWNDIIMPNRDPFTFAAFVLASLWLGLKKLPVWIKVVGFVIILSFAGQLSSYGLTEIANKIGYRISFFAFVALVTFIKMRNDYISTNDTEKKFFSGRITLPVKIALSLYEVTSIEYNCNRGATLKNGGSIMMPRDIRINTSAEMTTITFKSWQFDDFSAWSLRGKVRGFEIYSKRTGLIRVPEGAELFMSGEYDESMTASLSFRN